MNKRDLILEWTKDPFPKEARVLANQVLKKYDSGKVTNEVEAFTTLLEFGTGGIRGKIGFGVGRMNEFTVGRASLGFSRWLKKQFKNPSIVIAYDSRRMSVNFAKVSAGIAISMGIKVYLFKEVTPTPLLSFAVRYFNTSGGIVITASHNPPDYNGFKAYLSDGGQLIPPFDQEIISEIYKITDWNEISFIKHTDEKFKKNIHYIGIDCFEAYKAKIKKSKIISSELKNEDRKKLKVVYSPLHGTGGKYMKELLSFFGYKKVFLVPEEKKPNGEFPTVKYPNPEEKDALKLSLKYAKLRNADLFIATDPDADRLGVGVKSGKNRYVQLNGNQIGSIMSAYLAEKFGNKKKSRLYKTIVTTDLQAEIAKKNKIEYKNVLTGFKYIAEEMTRLEKTKEAEYLFGGEESFGYLPVDFVRDKDSLSSALLLLEIITEKKDILKYLDEIYLQYGLYIENLLSINLEGEEGKTKINQSINLIRNHSLLDKTIGSRKIIGFLDFKEKKQIGFQKIPNFNELPKSNVIQLELEGGGFLTVRPSGTEPKLKIYTSLKSIENPKDEKQLAILKVQLEKELKEIETAFFKLLNL